MARWCTTSSTDWKDFLPSRCCSRCWPHHWQWSAPLGTSEQRSLSGRSISRWSWWVQKCQPLAFYNQSSWHFQPHQPWTFSVFWGFLRWSLQCLWVGGVGFSSGLGGGRREHFLAISGEGPFHSKKEEATVLGAVFHHPFKLIGALMLFYINYLKGKPVVDELNRLWQVTSQGCKPSRDAHHPDPGFRSTP